MRAVVPLRDLNHRLPTLGRIRIGVKVPGTSKNGKAYERPKSIDTFRLTSHDQEALEQVAAIYGGTVKPWNEPKADPGQFEVITTANELRVVLPPDPLGGSPTYEYWTGGGADRRCDGITCARMVKGPEGTEQIEVPCLCTAEGAMACDPYTRLSVILPEVRFGGVWMLATKGWDAAQELPGMVELLASMQDRGLTNGLLKLEHRRKVVAGETRHFPVPVLALMDSMDALVAGAARFGSIGASSSVPALSSGEGDSESTDGRAPGIAASSPDDDVVDAELVDDRSLADVLPADASASRALAIARKLGSSATSCEEVRGYELVAKVLDQMHLVGETP